MQPVEASSRAIRSRQPVGVSSRQPVEPVGRGSQSRPVEASSRGQFEAANRASPPSQSVEAASRGQSRQPKILPKSVPGGVGNPRAVPSAPQECQDSTEELIRSASERFQISPGRPKSSQRRSDRAPRTAQSGPKSVQEGFGSLSKSESVIFRNLRSRLHGSVIFDGRGSPGSDQNRLSRASRGLC